MRKKLKQVQNGIAIHLPAYTIPLFQGLQSKPPLTAMLNACSFQMRFCLPLKQGDLLDKAKQPIQTDLKN
jgi:hypothetical protein